MASSMVSLCFTFSSRFSWFPVLWVAPNGIVSTLWKQNHSAIQALQAALPPVRIQKMSEIVEMICCCLQKKDIDEKNIMNEALFWDKWAWEMPWFQKNPLHCNWKCTTNGSMHLMPWRRPKVGFGTSTQLPTFSPLAPRNFRHLDISIFQALAICINSKCRRPLESYQNR